MTAWRFVIVCVSRRAASPLEAPSSRPSMPVGGRARPADRDVAGGGGGATGGSRAADRRAEQRRRRPAPSNTDGTSGSSKSGVGSPAQPQVTLSASLDVPQTMLSTSPLVPHTMLSQSSWRALPCPTRCCRTRCFGSHSGAPDDVVALAGRGRTDACPTRCCRSRPRRTPCPTRCCRTRRRRRPCPRRCCRTPARARSSARAPDDVVALVLGRSRPCPRRCCRRPAPRCPTRCCRTPVAGSHSVPHTMLSPSPSSNAPHTVFERPGAARRLDDAVLQLVVAPDGSSCPTARSTGYGWPGLRRHRGTSPGRPRPWCSGSRRPASAGRSGSPAPCTG